MLMHCGYFLGVYPRIRSFKRSNVAHDLTEVLEGESFWIACDYENDYPFAYQTRFFFRNKTFDLKKVRIPNKFYCYFTT